MRGSRTVVSRMSALTRSKREFSLAAVPSIFFSCRESLPIITGRGLQRAAVWRGFIAKTPEVLSAESARDAKQLGISHSRATSMAQALPCVGLRQLTGTEALDDHLLRGEIIWRRTCSTRKGNFMLRPVSHGFLLGFTIAPSSYLSWCRIQSIPCPFSSCRPRGVRSR